VKLTVANSKEFERLLDGLGSDVVGAAIHYRLYKDLRESVAHYERELNQSPAFWSLTFGAHIDAARARLFRVYDQRPDTLCLRNFLETISESLHLFGGGSGAAAPDVIDRGARPPDLAVLTQDLALVIPSDPLVKTLVALRGNLYAHRNAKNVAQELKVEERFSLAHAEVETLINRAVQIANKYSALFRRSHWSTQMVGHDDYQQVLQSVREYVERREGQIDEDLAKVKRRAGL
jgi:hypothetical protein